MLLFILLNGWLFGVGGNIEWCRSLLHTARGRVVTLSVAEKLIEVV